MLFYLTNELGEAGFLAGGVVLVDDILLRGFIQGSKGGGKGLVGLFNVCARSQLFYGFGSFADGFQGFHVSDSALEVLAGGFDGGLGIGHGESCNVKHVT